MSDLLYNNRVAYDMIVKGTKQHGVPEEMIKTTADHEKNRVGTDDIAHKQEGSPSRSTLEHVV